jgi:hypothetical protein
VRNSRSFPSEPAVSESDGVPFKKRSPPEYWLSDEKPNAGEKVVALSP